MSADSRKPSDQEVAAQMFGKTTPTREGEIPGDRKGAPLTYKWTAPPELAHLNLQDDPEMGEIFSGVARKLNLTNEQANALLHTHLLLVHDPKPKEQP